jgi:hypothetical protein
MVSQTHRLQLGIATLTVGVLLYRAAQQLGCHTRVELPQRLGSCSLQRPTHRSPLLTSRAGHAHRMGYLHALA